MIFKGKNATGVFAALCPACQPGAARLGLQPLGFQLLLVGRRQLGWPLFDNHLNHSERGLRTPAACEQVAALGVAPGAPVCSGF